MIHTLRKSDDGEVIEIVMTKPVNAHLHLRNGSMLELVLPETLRQFSAAVVKPNLVPPVTTVRMAYEYREEIENCTAACEIAFHPMMTMFFTDDLHPDEVTRAKASGFIYGIKMYPAGASTNSATGVTDLANVRDVLDRMEEVGMPLLVHGEVTDPGTDVFDLEERFLHDVLTPLVYAWNPRLRVVLEHITTLAAAAYVEAGPETLFATITPHHLLENRNAMFRYGGKSGLRPDHYCLPVLKREEDREELVRAATSGSSKFMAGTDSAPHTPAKKYAHCGCAGIFCEPVALAAYTQVFASPGASDLWVDRLDAFLNRNARAFYGLPESDETVTLRKEPWIVPKRLHGHGFSVTPYKAGETMPWRVVTD